MAMDNQSRSDQDPSQAGQQDPESTKKKSKELEEMMRQANELGRPVNQVTTGPAVLRDDSELQPMINDNPALRSDILQTNLEGQSARPSKRRGSSPKEEFIGYGKQLKLERELRGWTREELAEKISAPLLIVQKWENALAVPDRTFRRRLAEQLGNYYSLSSEVLTNGDLQVRVVQIELTAHDFTTIISALTEFYTQFWLLQQGRIDDLVKYTKSQDSRFVREANLVIDNLASNSPALITFFTDPGIATSAVTSSVTLAVAMQKAVDAIAQVWVKIIDAKIDARNKGALQRKKEEEERRKLIKAALHDIASIIDEVQPGADQQTRTMLVKAMLPKYLDFIEKGVKFDLTLL